MIQISRKQILRTIKEYTLMFLGLLLYSFGWMGIILPAKIVGRGVAGMSMLIYFATGGADGGIPVAYSMFVINGVLLAVAAIIIGIKFSAKTIFAVFALAFKRARVHINKDLLIERKQIVLARGIHSIADFAPKHNAAPRAKVLTRRPRTVTIGLGTPAARPLHRQTRRGRQDGKES